MAKNSNDLRIGFPTAHMGDYDMEIQIIIILLSGAAGANIAGAAMKGDNPGFFYNSFAGMAGGIIGGGLLAAILPTLGVIPSIISNIIGGGVGGGGLMMIISMIKKAMAK